jgi:hypothetical protein
MDNLKRLTIGVLGATNIARQFAAAVADSHLMEVAAVTSRTIEKSRQFADELNVKGSYGSYEALLADPNIDTVNVPLRPCMNKAMRSNANLEMFTVPGPDPDSDGLARVSTLGFAKTPKDIAGLLKLDVFKDIDRVLDATSAGGHKHHDEVPRVHGVPANTRREVMR